MFGLVIAGRLAEQFKRLKMNKEEYKNLLTILEWATLEDYSDLVALKHLKKDYSMDVICREEEELMEIYHI